MKGKGGEERVERKGGEKGRRAIGGWIEEKAEGREEGETGRRRRGKEWSEEAGMERRESEGDMEGG